MSTPKQSLDRQTRTLRDAQADVIYSETGSGAKQDRPGLAALLGALEEGDVVVVVDLTRLTRCGVVDFLRLVEQIHEAGATFACLSPPLDTSTRMGQFVLSIFALLGQMQRELLVDATRDGLQAARARGKKLGRPTALSEPQRAEALRLLSQGRSAAAVAELFSVSRMTIYRLKQAAP